MLNFSLLASTAKEKKMNHIQSVRMTTVISFFSAPGFNQGVKELTPCFNWKISISPFLT